MHGRDDYPPPHQRGDSFGMPNEPPYRYNSYNPPHEPPVMRQSAFSSSGYAPESFPPDPRFREDFQRLPPEGPYPRDPYTRDPYARDPYARDPYARDPYPREPYPRDPYARDTRPYRDPGMDPYMNPRAPYPRHPQDPYNRQEPPMRPQEPMNPYYRPNDGLLRVPDARGNPYPRQDPYMRGTPRDEPEKRPYERQPPRPIPPELPSPEQYSQAEAALSKFPYNKILQDIQSALLRKNIDVEAALKELDPNEFGVVPQKDFIETLRDKAGLLGMGICSPEELTTIAKAFDFHSKGQVFFLEFLKKVRNTDYKLGSNYTSRKIDPEWLEKTYKKIASVINEKNIQLDSLFLSHDPNNTSRVASKDFQQVLNSIMYMNPEEVYSVSEEFDPRKEGSVNYRQFTSKVQEHLHKVQVAARIQQALEKFCIEKTLNFEEKLREIDPMDTKRLTKADFVKFLTKLEFNATYMELDYFAEEIPKDREGNLLLTELCRKLPKPKQTFNVEKTMNLIKSYITKNKLTVSGAFSSFDTSKDGHLDPYEFTQALNQMGISGLTTDHIATLLSHIDKDKDGRISVTDFAEKIGLPLDPLETSVSHKFFRRIIVFLRNKGQTLLEFFRELDEDKSNSIGKTEFSRLLGLLNIEIDPLDADKLFSEIDTSRNGSISFMEFINKFESVASTLEKRDSENISRIKRALKGKRPGDVFRLNYSEDFNQQSMPAREFSQGLEFLSCNLTNSDIQHIVSQYERSGVVYVKDISDLFEQEMLYTKTNPEVHLDDPQGHWAQKWFRQISDFANRSGTSVLQALMSYCSSPEGLMTHEEFSNALNMIALDISNSEIDRLARELRRDGKISVFELCDLIQGKQIDHSERILADVKSYFESSNKKIEEVFRVDSAGNIYRPDVIDGLKNMKITVTAQQLVEVMTKLNPDIQRLNIGNPELQKVTRQQLMSKLNLREPQTTMHLSVKQVEERIKQGIFNEMAEFASSKSLNLERDVFQPYDRYGTYRVNTQSMVEILQYLTDKKVSDEQLRMIVKDYDPQDSGFVEYRNFISKMEDAMVYNSFSSRTLQRINQEVTSKGVNLTLVFQEKDQDNKGFLPFNDLFSALTQRGISVSREDLSKLVRPYEHDSLGRTSYTELVSKVHGVPPQRLPTQNLVPQSLPTQNFQPQNLPPQSLSVEQLFQKVESVWKANNVKAEDKFRNYDIEDSGSMTVSLFYQALTYSGVYLNNQEFEALAEASPKDRNGNILYKEFIARILGVPSSEHLAEVFRNIKRQVEVKRINLHELMREYDTYGDKLISKVNISGVFASSKISLSESELDAIFAHLDTRKTGLINYEELIRKVNPQVITLPERKEKPKYWAQHYLDQIKTYAENQNLTVKQLFSRFDKDYSNSLSVPEFKSALNELNVYVPPQDLEKLINEVDYKNQGTIHLSEFEALFPEKANQEHKLKQLILDTKKAVELKRLDIRSLFAVKDRNNTGKVHIKDFIEVLKEMNPGLGPMDCRLVADSLELDHNQNVDYNSFISKLEEDKVSMINFRLKEYLKSQKLSLVKILEPYDPGDHYLAPNNIRKAIESIQPPLSPEEISSLIHDNNLAKSSDMRLSIKDLLDRIGLREILSEPLASPSEIYDRVHQHWQATRADPITVFKAFDYEGDFHLTKNNFMESLVRNNIPLTLEEVNTVWPELEKLPDGRASAQHFIRLVLKQESPNKHTFEAIKNACGRQNLQALLQRYDTYRENKLSRQDFEKALQALNVSLSQRDIHLVFQELDRNSEGKLYIPELVSKVLSSSPGFQQGPDLSFAEELVRSIAIALSEMRQSSYQYFRKYPIDSQGNLSVNDFRDALLKLGINPASWETQRLVNELSMPESNQVNFKEFHSFLDEAITKLKQAPPKFQAPVTGKPYQKILSRQDLEYLYTCFDYIGDCIRKDFGDISKVARADTSRNGYLSYSEFKEFINHDLKIPSQDDVFHDMYALLDDGTGQIPMRRVIDAFGGVRIEQVNTGTIYLPEEREPTRASREPRTQKPPLQVLVDFLTQKKLNVFNIFGKTSGVISKEAFIRCLDTQRVPLSISGMNELALSVSEGQSVSLDKLADLLPESNAPRSILRKSDTANILNQELLKLGISAEEAFDKYDTDRNGAISLQEFLNACRDLRISLPEKELEELFSSIDVNRTRSISINEFARIVPGARLSIQQRAQKLDLGEQFEDEVKSLFDLLDVDKDGAIDQDEILAAIKSYGIIPNASQARDIIRKYDINHNNKLEYDEFRAIMEDTLKVEILAQEDDMQDLRSKFMEADYLKLGYLEPQQAINCIRKIGVNATDEEIAHLISMADTNSDGKIDIEEFMLIMTGRDTSVYSDETACAVLFNIRKARRVKPVDFVKVFTKMPKHFIPSFISEQHKLGKWLPSNGIAPSLDKSGVKDVQMQASNSKMQSLTYLKQNPATAGGFLTLERASGVSIPDSTLVPRESIVKRIVRISNWDSAAMSFIGNSIHLEAYWRAEIEDRWTFENQLDKEANQFVAKIGQNQNPEKVELVFEFVVVVNRENTTVELSCGFCKILYSQLMLRKNHKVTLQSGTPENPSSVANEDIRTYRKGLRHILKMTGITSVSCRARFNFRSVQRLNLIEQGQLESLPEVCVMHKEGLHICRIYREYTAALFAEKLGKDFVMPNVSDPFLTQFPKVLNCPDTWMPLISFWNSVEFNRTLTTRNNEEYKNELVNIVYKLYSIMHSKEFAYDLYQPTKFSEGIRGDLYSKRSNLVMQVLKKDPKLSFSKHQYTPFDVSEVSSKTLVNLDSMFTQSIRTKGEKVNKGRIIETIKGNSLGKSSSSFYSSKRVTFNS